MPEFVSEERKGDGGGGGATALPDFENPPVVETVLSVQFEQLSSFGLVHYGLIWDYFKEAYPKHEHRPPLDPVIERFPEPLLSAERPRFEIQDEPLLPRLWLLNAQQTEIIQIQKDRFIKNWRKTRGDAVYPHYEPHIRPGFQRDFDKFRGFILGEGLEPAIVNQCEISYVNHIVSGDGWTTFSDAKLVFNLCCPNFGGARPGEPEDWRFRARYRIPGVDGSPVGRLHVEINPAYHVPDNRPMFVMTLTARGHIGNQLDFFDIGRDWIVRSFESVTTPQMHEVWGRKHRE
jgi:uncharacterized protein (TIGR04255 family)